MNSSYITSAQQAEQLPDLGGLPEVAFIGRSNCGKSSLLNALLARSNLARTSKTPGRTQMVNFFDVAKGTDNQEKLILADLPGYGYSAIGKDVRHHWEALVAAYLQRPQIRAFLFLVDARRAGDLDKDDLDLLKHVARRAAHGTLSGVEVVVVLTKTDKCNQREIAAAQAAVVAATLKLKITLAAVVPVSVLKKKGIEGLRDRVLAHMTLAPTAPGAAPG